MIDWFVKLTIDQQSLVILMTAIVIGAVVVIIGANCPRKVARYEELQQEQEKMIGKMK